jgi:hypothetical protein
VNALDLNRERDIAEDVRAGMQIFVVAVKNCALYPENSKIRRASLEKLQEWFTEFLDEHESLKLFVDMDSFLFQGVSVYQEKPGESAMVFPFFRDGVQWIEFMEGMDRSELETLIDNLNRFRMLREDDEDDLVTALWEADLQNIKYKTANEFWEIDPVTEIAAFKVAVGQSGEAALDGLNRKALATAARNKAQESGGGKALGALVSWIRNGARISSRESFLFPEEGDLCPPETGLEGDDDGSQDEDYQESGRRHQTWAISPQERAEMERLLSDEAKRSHLGLGIDLTLELLVQHGDPESQGTVLKFLAEMVKFAFARGDFGAPILILGKLEGLIRAASPALDQMRAEFPKWLATEPVMEGLIALAPLKDRPEEAAVSFRRLLSILPPDSHRLLAATAAKCRDEMIKSQLLLAVAERAPGGGHELGLFLNSTLPTADIVSLIGMVKGRELKEYMDFLSASARHVQREVREAASRVILEANTDLIAHLPQLLAEPEPSLARQIHWILGQRRSPVVERVLVNFLAQTIDLSVSRPRDQLMLCYRTLGLVAATRTAADFASEILLKKDMKAFFGLSGEKEKIHRAGAALALHFIPAQYGSQEILESASRSFYRSLRAASAQAREEVAAFKSMSGQI